MELLCPDWLAIENRLPLLVPKLKPVACPVKLIPKAFVKGIVASDVEPINAGESEGLEVVELIPKVNAGDILD